MSGRAATKFTPKVCDSLGQYVYLYVDPRTHQAFYVGKGTGKRCFAHLDERGHSKKSSVLRELHRLGLEPTIDILKYGLTEKESLLVEATAIDLLGLHSLTNRVRGHGSRVGSRGVAGDIADELAAKQARIIDRVILININRAYRPGMTIPELYDATRSAWKVAPDRHASEFALSVYRGIVREVFRIAGWHPAGSTMKANDPQARPRPRATRMEFVGHLAEERIRTRYLGRSVAQYYKPGAQNPVQYVNC